MERRLWRTTLRACRWSQAVWSSHSTRTRLVRMPLVYKRSTFLPRMSSRCWPSLCRRTRSAWCWDRVTEVQDAWPVIHLAHTVCVSTLCCCLLYTSDAADDLLCVDLGGRRI